MIKKRETTNLLSEEEFINGANEQLTPKLDPKASRKFKTHTIPMNEYEYQLLAKLLKSTVKLIMELSDLL